MAKRKQQPIDKQTLLATRPAEIAQAFNDGDLKRFYDEWQKLCNRLAASPDLLAQAEYAIAFAITDEGTLEARRLGAFRAVVKVNPYEYPDYGALHNMGTDLHEFEHYHAAITKYEQALKLKPDEYMILNNYGSALNNLGQHCNAITKFDHVLKLKPDYPDCWNNYGVALADMEQYEEAISKYKQALRLKSDYPECLYNYGSALRGLKHYEEAINKYKQALKLKPIFLECLSGYAMLLVELDRYEEAITIFEQVLKLKPDNYNILNKYGYVLSTLERYEESIAKFDQALRLEPEFTLTWLNFGVTLIKSKKYKEAITKFKHALNTPMAEQFVNIIYLALGSLYYRTQQETQAKYYIDRLLEISDDKDAQKIRIAQELFTINHDSDEAFDLLDEIIETSPHYKEAKQLFGRRAAGKRYFDKFKTSDDDISVKDTQALNRSMYHKIANEVAILKELAYEVVADYPAQNALLQRVMASIDGVLQGVKQRRETEKIQGDFQQILQAIEKTAHDVSDFVNNELAIVEEEIRYALDDDPTAPQAALSELLGQIKTTQVALNDLKAINEGINIKYSRFPVSELFEVWLNKSQFAQAALSVDLANGESIFYGDKAKLKSMLNEWVENSLRHNPDKANLTIHMAARDEVGPPKRLVITYQDNGQGVPSKHRDKIFLPLFTTSTVGSGLGLFIIKRTINQMHGEIVEKGEHGVLFEVTIPYTES